MSLHHILRLHPLHSQEPWTASLPTITSHLVTLIIVLLLLIPTLGFLLADTFFLQCNS